MRILLLVEDNPNDVILAKRIIHTVLSSSQVIDCPDAETAFLYLESANPKPDLVLVDLGLPPPGMDGMEFIRRIKADTRYNKIPLAILTGWATDIVQASALKTDLKYIIKPMGIDEFKALLEKVGFTYA